MDKELKKIQMCQLDLALEVKRICDMYNVPYFFIGGTLLGTVRHEGFIPWDDDLDFGLLRNDYDKFVELCNENLNEEFYLQTAETDPEFGFGFAKLRINNTRYTEEICQYNKSHKGIFIDIFPFDNMPERKKEQIEQYRKVKILRFLLLAKCNYRTWDKNNKFKKLLMTIANIFLKPIPKKNLLNSLIKLETKYNTTDTKYIINLEGAYNYKEFIPRKCINNLHHAMFEGYLFKIPSNPEIYLSNLYKDFMELPPEEKRFNRHGIIEIDFGSYCIKNKMNSQV